MEIEVKIRPSTLHLVNCLFQKITFCYDKQGYVEKSIAKQLAVKLARKQFSLFGKNTRKDYKLTLHYHDAELLERKVRTVNDFEYEMLHISEAEWIMVNEFCNQIAQKTA